MVGILSALPKTIDAVGRVVEVFTPNKTVRESNIHDEQMSTQEGYASENLQVRNNRTWWDSFVDGLNRLPRPLLGFMAIGVLFWAPIDPVAFSIAMRAYELMPNWLAAVLAQIIVLLFGGRMLTEHFNMKAKSNAEVKAVLDDIKYLKETYQTGKAIDTPEPDPYEVAGKISDKEYKEQMADNSKPLSLDAIVEWNRRKGNGN